MSWLIAAGIWGFAEATLFFIVPDVLLSALALRNLRAALIASLLAVAGAVAGGAVMYGWGAAQPQAAVETVAQVPAVGEAMMARAHADMVEDGAIATVFGPLTATPYKVYAVQASDAGIPFWLFMAITPIARLPRFLLVSLIAGGAAHLLKPRLGQRALYAIWAVGWVIVYTLLWGGFTASPG